MVVDVENLFMSVHKEEDTDTKQVYFYLFKVSAILPVDRRKTTDAQPHSCCVRLVILIGVVVFFSLPAVEEMHLADEPAPGRRVIGKPPI